MPQPFLNPKTLNVYSNIKLPERNTPLLFNSNTELKQNAAWKQGAFPLSSRTPFKKEFSAFVDFQFI